MFRVDICSAFLSPSEKVIPVKDMRSLRSVCVYCGSRFGDNPAYKNAAESLGAGLAGAGLQLVYGGGSVGLMGVTARACVEAGGDVIGIIPEHLDRIEITQEGLTELIVTHNMHDRKHKMFDRADAFVILPGGLGTLDETFEIMTWAQLNLHRKPIILLNIEGYWTKLVELVNDIVAAGFASADHAALLQHFDSVDDVLEALRMAQVSTRAVDSSLL